MVRPVRQRAMQWSTPSGYVTLAWPERMSPDDAAEAVEAVELALRNLRRIAEALPNFDGYEAAMNAVLGVSA